MLVLYQPCTEKESVSAHGSLPILTINELSRSAVSKCAKVGKLEAALEGKFDLDSLTPSQQSAFLHQFRALPQAQVADGRSDRSTGKSRRVTGDHDDDVDVSLPCELEGWSLRSASAGVHGVPSLDTFEASLISSIRVLDSVKLVTTRRGQMISPAGTSPPAFENLPLSTEPLKLRHLSPSGVKSMLMHECTHE